MSPQPRVLLCRDIPTQLLDNAETDGKLSIVRRPVKDAATPAPRQWILDHIGDVDAVIITLTEPIDAEIIEAGKHLRVISSMSVGTDHIDLESAQRHTIKIGTTPTVLDDAVAELSLLLVLAASRNLAAASQIVRSGQWGRNPWAPLAFCGPALANKTIGFLGFGNIAQSTAALLPVFRPKRIIYTTSSPRPFSPDSHHFARLAEKGFPFAQIPIQNEPDIGKLAAQSDVVIVLTPFSATTKHLVNEKFLKSMKPTAILVNTSRGGVVDTAALAEAVECGQIAGAGLDVLEGEPNISADHRLLRGKCAERVIVLPHIGSATFEARSDMADLTVRHVLQAFQIPS